MSDWAATMSGIPSVLAGLDMTMPGYITFGSGTSYFGENLVKGNFFTEFFYFFTGFYFFFLLNLYIFFTEFLFFYWIFIFFY